MNSYNVAQNERIKRQKEGRGGEGGMRIKNTWYHAYMFTKKKQSAIIQTKNRRRHLLFEKRRHIIL